jgi:hypothetical protein
VQQQQGEDAALPRSPEAQGTTVQADLERSEYPEVSGQGPTLTGGHGVVVESVKVTVPV